MIQFLPPWRVWRAGHFYFCYCWDIRALWWQRSSAIFFMSLLMLLRKLYCSFFFFGMKLLRRWCVACDTRRPPEHNVVHSFLCSDALTCTSFSYLLFCYYFLSACIFSVGDVLCVTRPGLPYVLSFSLSFFIIRLWHRRLASRHIHSNSSSINITDSGGNAKF